MKKLIALLSVVACTLPFSVSAQSSVDLQAQAAALLQQVQALQAQIAAQGGVQSSVVNPSTGTGAPVSGAAGVNSSACPNIGRVLKAGSTGDDVTRLQQFLARDPSVYPEGTVTGYFGGLTEKAVQRWQVKYNIVSSGSPASTGYGVVGPRTAAAIALLCSTGGAGAGGPSTVGGYVQVSPISGSAPLTVNVVATINTTNSCSGTIYTLNWGDNTNPIQIPVSANNCNQMGQTFQHVYQTAGNYTIALSAGQHRTTAQVAVYGNAGGTPTQNGNLPAQTMNATPLSGSAPLSVSFTGVINSNNLGYCASGCSSELDFGDGTNAQLTIPAQQNAWQNFAVTHIYQNAGQYTAVLYQGAKSATGRPPIGNASISVTSVASNYTYQAMTISPNVGGNPMALSIGFDLPTTCTGYTVNWGDNTTVTTQADGGTSCAQTTSSKSLQHTYTAAGSYTITLKRGANLSRVDTAGLAITN